MSPKRTRAASKTVTIYNSNTSASGPILCKKQDKKYNCYEQSRNNMDNWEFHFKSVELEKVRAIIKCKDLSGVPLIIGAVVLDHQDILMNLIKHGYNVNEADRNSVTPLGWAIKLKHLEMACCLIENNADPALRIGDDVLFLALGNSQWDEESFVQLYKFSNSAGCANINATNKNGLSMLHLAVRREWNELVDLLILNDANINISNPNGVTPLMLASYRNDESIVAKLLSKGANVKRRNADGFTALCYAFSSAIMKNVRPPYKVVEMLQAELARNKVYLSDYLKDRLKIIANRPIKRSGADQPNAEQMMQHILTFIVCNVGGGFDVLWSELNVACVIKEAFMKNMEDKEHLRLPLLMLNTLVKTLPLCPGCLDSEDLIVQGLIKTGCFDMSINIAKRYSEDATSVYLALTPIVLCCKSLAVVPRWMCTKKEELIKTHTRYLEVLENIGSSDEERKMITERASDLKLRLAKCTDIGLLPDHPCLTSSPSPKPTLPLGSVKKNRRRTKALKTKIAKIKTADLSARFNLDQIREINEKQPPSEGSSTDCANAIKAAISILEDDTAHSETIKFAPQNYDKDDWRSDVRKLPFHSCPNLKFYHENYDKDVDIDMVVKYMEGLLGSIVTKYKIIWQLGPPFDTLRDIDIITPIGEDPLGPEKENLRTVHREFYDLTRKVRQNFDCDAEGSMQLLKQLERLLLTHSVRGETILEQAAAMEVIRVSVEMPPDFENILPEYMEKVVNEEIDEVPGVTIQVLEHVTAEKKVDHNSMGDYVYMDELFVSPEKACSVKRDYSTVFNLCEDADDNVERGCEVEEDAREPRDSRWYSLLRSLQMMEDGQSYLSGKIRISNAEKRKSHVLSPGGNFAALEIGLGEKNLALAVKFVPKNDVYAGLLRAQIEPILEIRHRNILHYYICAYDASFLIIASPLCEYNLGQYVLKMKHSQMKICKVDIIRQILAGLMFLHDHDEPIVHGNLKPSNVLVDVNGNIRIAEFGIHQALLKLKNLPESTVIWFATESLKLYKQNGPVECTCASDIQVAGMLAHFAVNNGSHAFGKDVPDIIKNLEKATPQIMSNDMELYDLLTWMLLGEPSERPTIHQVLSHIFFWSNKKKWRYIQACAGIDKHSTIPMDIDHLHASLDKTAHKENIVGNCWVLTAKRQYPEVTFIDNNDTPSGLLKFIKVVIENDLVIQDDSEKGLSSFILNAFPYFALSLYRMIENTEWSDHRLFMPFHNVVDY